MNLHEYQARALLKSAGIPMLDGDVASTPSEAESIARRIGGKVVIKAQVHSGGRGKAGGVKLARNPGEAADHASQILGMTIKGLVVVRPGHAVTEPELIAFCRGRMAHFKCPTSIEFRDTLLRTATGKLQKFKLRSPYWEGREKLVN